MSEGPVLALELNDVGLRVAGHPALSELEPSPGVALVDERSIVTGPAAVERARLEPRRTRRGFWGELSLEAMGRPFPPGLRTADLAYVHLAELWRGVLDRLEEGPPAGVLLVTPSACRPDQLALILGIARRAGLPVTGLVDAAVAAVSRAEDSFGSESRLYLDLELGRASASEVSIRDGALARGRVETDERAGLAVLEDTWARAIAKLFVRSTRFDPLHSASAEQELYRRLPEWLGRLGTEEAIDITLSGAGREHALSLPRERMVAAADGIYTRLRELADAAPAGLVVSHRVAGLPGLVERFEEAGQHVARLPDDAALSAALEQAPAVHSPGVGGLPLTTRLVALATARLAQGGELTADGAA